MLGLDCNQTPLSKYLNQLKAQTETIDNNIDPVYNWLVFSFMLIEIV